MIVLKKLILILICFLLFSCQSKEEQHIPISKNPAEKSVSIERQEEIIDEYLHNCAAKQPLYSVERQECLDRGLAKDSTIAYLWQQKAMPLFKQRKYEVGMKYIDEAVKYNPERWQPYRAFIKCIFAKTYQEAIEDFQACIASYGNSYVMDHTYKFHIGLSYLQLNKFEAAQKIFEEDMEEQIAEWGENGLHHLDLFYYGISKYEQGKFEEAIEEFDKALKLYPKFSDVEYYKAISLYRLGREEEALLIMDSARENGLAGNTINEDNVIYESYPYQVRW
ncbi:tetratricopeptide repeat protein [Salinimicrobium marinum]|nr:tetratricopeptide repeat protein [Salinimicrobium marinum]